MDSFIQMITDGCVHVVSEHFHRNRKTMGGSFDLKYWDKKTGKWAGKVILHWYYRKYNETWDIREQRLKRYWPIVEPWIRSRLIADTNSYDEAPDSAKHEQERA